MKRHQIILGSISLFLTLWSAVFFGVTDFGLDEKAVQVVNALPSYALIVLGCYALLSIGWDLFNFGDCPEAAKELEKHIEEAREDLKRRGYVEPPLPKGKDD